MRPNFVHCSIMQSLAHVAFICTEKENFIMVITAMAIIALMTGEREEDGTDNSSSTEKEMT